MIDPNVQIAAVSVAAQKHGNTKNPVDPNIGPEPMERLPHRRGLRRDPVPPAAGAYTSTLHLFTLRRVGRTALDRSDGRPPIGACLASLTLFRIMSPWCLRIGCWLALALR
jgi:hypothetical protein